MKGGLFLFHNEPPPRCGESEHTQKVPRPGGDASKPDQEEPPTGEDTLWAVYKQPPPEEGHLEGSHNRPLPRSDALLSFPKHGLLREVGLFGSSKQRKPFPSARQDALLPRMALASAFQDSPKIRTTLRPSSKTLAKDGSRRRPPLTTLQKFARWPGLPVKRLLDPAPGGFRPS